MKLDKIMKEFNYVVKIVSIVCAIVLFAATFNWFIEYYMPLRILVFTGAILCAIANYKYIFILTTFCLVAVLFNPIFPIYLYIKSYWIPIDILTGVLFLLIAFYKAKTRREKKGMKGAKITKSYKRDIIY